MRAVLHIAAHELRGYVRAPAAWGIAALFLAVQGVAFAGQVQALSDPKRPAPLGAVLEGFFAGSLLTWSLALAVIALIATRAIAEDRRAGTWETLVTAPVGEGAAIAGKWLAGAAFHAALWVPTLAYLVVVGWFRPEGASWDAGPVVGAYLGVVLMGAALLAVALAASALAPSPLAAGVVSYAALMLVLLVGELPALLPELPAEHPTVAAVIDACAIRARLAEMARGELTFASLALFGGLGAVGLSLAVTAACAGRRRRGEVATRALASLLVLVIAVQLGAAARRWPVAWDLTARGANSLEAATREALAALDTPTTITIVRPSLAEFEPVFGEAERVARRMARESARVTVRVLDPATAGLAAIARETGLVEGDLARSGAVVIDLGTRRGVIDLLDLASFAAGPTAAPVVARLSVEAEIVARLHELGDPRPLVVCATTGHGELGLAPDPAVAEIAGLATRVRGAGGRVEPVESVAAGVPPQCSVLLVAGPTQTLPAADALAIERWLGTGGGLLLLAAARPDGGALLPTGLEPVIAPFGIELVDAVAIDPTLSVDPSGGVLRVLTGYSAHPVAAGFQGRRPTLWIVPRALALRAPAEPVVSTSADGWGERTWREPPPQRDADDVRGPVPIVAAARRDRGGRVAVFGSAESISTLVVAGASAGEVLALQAIHWLAGRERPALAMRDKTPEQVRLVMTVGERRAMIALCAVGVPLGFGGLGAMLAWRRRRGRARQEAA